ncbi:uncharacterized protein LOC143046834 [Mytilus galloprovincialis]|uniref:uncharacterized protein LOC143046834 n=1 Tax=Mytilus galloprovincialis TaxID=29158 RepID=UPI003F7B7520
MSSFAKKDKWTKIQEMTKEWAGKDEVVVCLKLDLKSKKVKYAGPSFMKPFGSDVDVINKFLKYAERDGISNGEEMAVVPIGLPTMEIEDINLANLRKIISNIVASDVYKRKKVLKGFWGIECFRPVWYPQEVEFKSPNNTDNQGFVHVSTTTPKGIN